LSINYCNEDGRPHDWVIEARTNIYACEKCALHLNQIPGAPARTPVKPKAGKWCHAPSSASIVHYWYTSEDDGKDYCVNCSERR